MPETTQPVIPNIPRMKMLPARFPKIVCLCGSTRFKEEFERQNMIETLAGHIVLSVGVLDGRSLAAADDSAEARDKFSDMTAEERDRIKVMLDDLHKRKIDLSDEVLILNVGDYIGQSTRSELEYAKMHGKTIWFLEPHKENA